MTPLLMQFQNKLIESGMLRADQVTIYLTEVSPDYELPFDPDGHSQPCQIITLGLSAPATVVINPFSGDLVDLILVANLILDDMEPAAIGNANRLKISAEPLNKTESIIVMHVTLDETIQYVADESGHLTIDGVKFKRHVELRPGLKPLHSVNYVGP